LADVNVKSAGMIIAHRIVGKWYADGKPVAFFYLIICFFHVAYAYNYRHTEVLTWGQQPWISLPYNFQVASLSALLKL